MGISVIESREMVRVAVDAAKRLVEETIIEAASFGEGRDEAIDRCNRAQEALADMIGEDLANMYARSIMGPLGI